MAKKLKAQWTSQEMKNVGVHGFYGRPVYRGTFDFETFVTEKLQNTTYNPNEVIGAFKVLQKSIIQELSKGYRIDIGENFITLMPNLVLSVKDYEDKEGKTVVATSDMLKTSNIVSRIACSINNKYKKLFEAEVSWERVSKGGDIIEDDATQGNENIDQNEPSSIDTSTNTIDPSTNNQPGGMD